LDSLTGSTIELDATQIVAIAAFLRVINALENIRQSTYFLNSFLKRTFLGNEEFDKLLRRAGDETNDAIGVLAGGGLHPGAVAHLKKALSSINKAKDKRSVRKSTLEDALSELELARKELIQ
jgi:hypothetical protein